MSLWLTEDGRLTILIDSGPKCNIGKVRLFTSRDWDELDARLGFVYPEDDGCTVDITTAEEYSPWEVSEDMPHHFQEPVRFVEAEDGTCRPQISSRELYKDGYCIPVSIVSGSRAVTTMGLLDTGARRTCIATRLAEYIGLEAGKVRTNQTASGSVQTPDYRVDIHFLGTGLSSFKDFDIISSPLEFNIDETGPVLSKDNIGLLIGRDILSRWSVTWHGPTSTVFISD